MNTVTLDWKRSSYLSNWCFRKRKMEREVVEKRNPPLHLPRQDYSSMSFVSGASTFVKESIQLVWEQERQCTLQQCLNTSVLRSLLRRARRKCCPWQQEVSYCTQAYYYSSSKEWWGIKQACRRSDHCIRWCSSQHPCCASPQVKHQDLKWE